ncbi:MAG TPA: glycine cleavage system protein GcvH, partial [Acidimicrobiales bacterium]|nr:glycine cleavage system protein GcvH [Acidimicrobiales bacterium]
MTVNVPDELRYTDAHEWARLAAGRVVVGITDHAQEAMGDVVHVDEPRLGGHVERGEPVGEIESTKSVSEVYAPVAGTIVARNEALGAQPELVNS